MPGRGALLPIVVAATAALAADPAAAGPDTLRPASVRTARVTTIRGEWRASHLDIKDEENRLAQIMAQYSQVNHVTIILDAALLICTNQALDITAPLLAMAKGNSPAAETGGPASVRIAVYADQAVGSPDGPDFLRRAQAFCDSQGIDILIAKRWVTLSANALDVTPALAAYLARNPILDRHGRD